MASASTVITLGLGNGTLAGSPALLLTLGFGAGNVVTGPYLVVDSDLYVGGARDARTARLHVPPTDADLLDSTDLIDKDLWT